MKSIASILLVLFVMFTIVVGVYNTTPRVYDSTSSSMATHRKYDSDESNSTSNSTTSETKQWTKIPSFIKNTTYHSEEHSSCKIINNNYTPPLESRVSAVYVKIHNNQAIVIAGDYICTHRILSCECYEYNLSKIDILERYETRGSKIAILNTNHGEIRINLSPHYHYSSKEVCRFYIKSDSYEIGLKLFCEI